ncbi:hypothetical protein CA984_17455 [Streptosporangium minutum]|uniref:Uncharacterized protein n=1 Tax=Streptosporangium minutum TaxID=569862 RepID=A0A243RLQ4_9ACTN|nr:hypothetical protein CA984_17455 [Streptosporangium minutum]
MLAIDSSTSTAKLTSNPVASAAERPARRGRVPSGFPAFSDVAVATPAVFTRPPPQRPTTP